MGGSVPQIPGVKAEGDLAVSFRYEVAQLLDRKATTFPGAQPVSFGARHLTELQKQDYYVCEKSDGIRCLMYLTSDESQEVTYLIDRKNDYYYVPHLHFPLSVDSFPEFHTATVVDGELVNDTSPNGTIEMKYLVFDCLVLDGNSLMHRTLDKRLAYFREKVFIPYQALYKRYPEEIQYVPFIVQFKKMEFSYGIEMMFKDILPNLPHGNDGLIFTCRNTPYQFGTDQNILKWKSENENSVDFRLTLEFPIVNAGDYPDDDNEDGSPHPDYGAMPRFHLAVGGGSDGDIPYGTMVVEAPQWEDMKAENCPLNHRVVECYLNKQDQWKFLRWRDDKKDPNHIFTVESVIESIRDKVSKEDLIRASKKTREEWKKRLAAGAGVQRPKNDRNSESRSGSLGLKRKFEAHDEAVNGTDANG